MEQIIADFFVYLGAKIMDFLNFLDAYYGLTLLAYMTSMKYKVPTLNWYKQLTDKHRLTDFRDWIAAIVLIVAFLLFKRGMEGVFNFTYFSSVCLTALIILLVGSIFVAYMKRKAKDNDNKKE